MENPKNYTLVLEDLWLVNLSKYQFSDSLSRCDPFTFVAAGKDEVFVGRIREDESIDNGINMWIVSDNIRKGAALNTIQIAEKLL